MLSPVLLRCTVMAGFVSLAGILTLRGGEVQPSPTPASAPPVESRPVTPEPANAAPSPAGASVEQLLDQGRAWLEENFTEEQIAQLPQFDQKEFVALLQPVVNALASGRLENLAAARPQAAQALAWLRAQPWGQPYADWLAPRMDYLDMALEAVDVSRRQWEAEQQRAWPTPPSNRPSTLRFEVVRDRIYRNAQSRRAWDRKVAQHAPPARAAALAPQLKTVFRTEGVPAEWVWLAEVESSFNPDARSPAGARGLFQLMPATAQRFGLRTSPIDERTDPVKNSRAAAQYLRFLRGRFGDWPLALAAYNAGEGRVARALETSTIKTFDGISPQLPAETRFYVPRVLATVAARENVDPFALPAPAPPPAPPAGTSG